MDNLGMVGPVVVYEDLLNQHGLGWARGVLFVWGVCLGFRKHLCR